MIDEFIDFFNQYGLAVLNSQYLNSRDTFRTPSHEEVDVDDSMRAAAAPISRTFGPKLGLSKADRQTIEGNTLNNCTVMAAIGQSNIETSRLDKVFRYLSTDILPTIYPGISVMDYRRGLGLEI